MKCLIVFLFVLASLFTISSTSSYNWTSGTNTSAEPEAEGQSSVEPEVAQPAAASETEPEGEGEGEAEERPSPLEVVLPPFSLMIIIILGLFALSLWSQRSTWSGQMHDFVRAQEASNKALAAADARDTKEPPAVDDAFMVKVHPSRSDVLAPPGADGAVTMETPPGYEESESRTALTDANEVFLSPFDIEVLDSLSTFMNRPQELLRIALPSILSLALCPATLYLYAPFVNVFWPPAKYASPPDINDAIACFLAPAGLVYATSFGFAFQQALGKQHDVLKKMTFELGLLDQIVTLASKLSLPSLCHRMEIYRAAKAEAIFMVLQIENRGSTNFKNKAREDVKVQIWRIMDILRNISAEQKSTIELDKVIADKVIDHMLQLNSICSDRMGIFHTRIHPLKWAFLESLGFFSFFGVLLLRAQSYRMELVMCIITVFSISLLCYVVADLDSPFSGFFRVDVSVLPDVVGRMREMFERARAGHNVLCNYPERRPPVGARIKRLVRAKSQQVFASLEKLSDGTNAPTMLPNKNEELTDTIPDLVTPVGSREGVELIARKVSLQGQEEKNKP